MSTLNIKEALEAKEKEFRFTDDIFGMTLLTNPGYISSSRSLMFTSHLRQFVNLVHPDFPKVFTNYENTVGKNSTGYYRAKNDLEVVDKISKFDGDLENHLYLLFVYDKKKDKYSVIKKEIVADLTEKFGFAYINDNMDSKDVGDDIEKDEILYRTTSYDEDLNYMYGTNVKVMYAINNYTIEDAIVCSESFAKRMVSKEIESVKVSLNDNDILCNIYGDNDEYKGFPDINTYIKDKVVCAKRRIHNNQVLYDLKKSNLKKINFMNDVLFYNEGRVVDINIYNNKTLDEMPDNIFNNQIRKYISMQNAYYQKIYDRCREIIKSGSKYSNDIAYYYKRAKEILNPEVKWKDDSANVFSNMIIEFLVERDSPLTIGQKITGRMGNKGVVSKIVPDDEMPFLENGERVEVILNALGVVNRLNSFQVFELSINFITQQVAQHLRTLDNLKDKEIILFDIIRRFNEEQAKSVKEYYKSLNTKQKKEFFKDIDKDGIYIHEAPMWEKKEPLFDRIRDIYKDYPFIKPVDVYINKWGRKIKIMKPLIVSDLYMIKLKQSSKKGFSARSTGAVSRKGIPEKSFRNKLHQDLYSTTPIRIGDQENINSLIGVSAKNIAQLHSLYRSSVNGRRALAKKLVTKLKPINDIKNDDKYSNRNVEILQAYFKAMGLRIEFIGDKYEIDIPTTYLHSYDTENGLMICTKGEYEDYLMHQKIIHKYQDDVCLVTTTDEYEKIIQDEYEDKKMRKENYVIDINLDK